MTTVYKTIDIDVDVDADDFDDVDLIDILEQRGYIIFGGKSMSGPLHAIVDAISLGDKPGADKILRDLIYELTGRILP
jgi:hypothetical protein